MARGTRKSTGNLQTRVYTIENTIRLRSTPTISPYRFSIEFKSSNGLTVLCDDIALVSKVLDWSWAKLLRTKKNPRDSGGGTSGESSGVTTFTNAQPQNFICL